MTKTLLIPDMDYGREEVLQETRNAWTDTRTDGRTDSEGEVWLEVSRW